MTSDYTRQMLAQHAASNPVLAAIASQNHFMLNITQR